MTDSPIITVDNLRHEEHKAVIVALALVLGAAQDHEAAMPVPLEGLIAMESMLIKLTVNPHDRLFVQGILGRPLRTGLQLQAHYNPANARIADAIRQAILTTGADQ